MKKRKFNFSTLIAFLIGIVVLIVVVPINLIVSYYDKQYDLTPQKQYTFTDTTKQLLNDTADKKIEIFFLEEENNLRDAPEFLVLYNAFKQLDERDNITVKYILPDKEPQLISELNPSGAITINEGDILVRCGDTVKEIDRHRIFEFTSEEVLKSNSVEELLSGAVKIVTSGSLPTIYFLTGHGEKTIDDSYATVASMMKADNYDVQSLDLSQVDAVPENASIVLLAGPQKDITDDEKEKLLSFSEKGGSLSFLIAPVLSDVTFPNIESVLRTFELGIDYNIIVETVPEYEYQNHDGVQDEHVFPVQYTPTSDSFTVDLTTDILTLLSENALVSGISNTRSVKKLADNNSFIEKSSIITNLADEDGNYSTKALKASNTKMTDADLSGIELEFGYYSLNKETNAKMILLGTTDIIDTDNISDAVATTQSLYLSTITWLFNSDIEMNIGSKMNNYDYMAFESQEKAESSLKIFTIVPICVAFIGLAVWLKRRHS